VIWVWQENPLATTKASGFFRIAGNNACSPQSNDSWYLPSSKPHDPASPQQPPETGSTSIPIRSKIC
jgi:hypothetical protein